MTLKEQIKQKESEIAQLKELLSTDYKRIQSFEDACDDQAIDSTENRFRFFANCDNSTAAFERLKVIRNALLGDVKLEWSRNAVFKYFPVFKLTKNHGSGFIYSHSYVFDMTSVISSYLSLDSREKTIYFGYQFEDIWYKYMIEHRQ